MPDDLSRVRHAQASLLRLLEALERPASRTRTTVIAGLERQLGRVLPALEAHLPLGSSQAYIVHRGQPHSVAHLSVHGRGLPLSVRRRAIYRTLKLLGEAQLDLAERRNLDREASWLRTLQHEFAASLRAFGMRHPVLFALIIVALMALLIWQHDFTLTTRLGTAEITISGQQHADTTLPETTVTVP